MIRYRTHTRDIKNSRDGFLGTNLLLNLENMLEDGIFSDIIHISALGAEKFLQVTFSAL